ncbi:MAG: LuxR C-terminal-related transcriptional regulator [Pseudomonadota bacterium]
MRDPTQFLDTLEAIKNALDAQSATKIVHKYLGEFGIDTVGCAYTESFHPEKSLNDPDVECLVFLTYASSVKIQFPSKDIDPDSLFDNYPVRLPFYQGSRIPFVFRRNAQNGIEASDPNGSEFVSEFYSDRETFVYSVPMMATMSENLPAIGVTFRSDVRSKKLVPMFAKVKDQALKLAHVLNDKFLPEIHRSNDEILVLSERERECLQFIAFGLRPKQIAYRLEVTESTVKFHLQNVRSKLGAHSIAHAIALGIRYGQITA